MNLFTWLNKKIKLYKWYDISFIKLSSGAIILMIAKLWPPLLSLEWSTYLIIGIIAAIPPFYTMFKKK